jgi:hypothetical protein
VLLLWAFLLTTLGWPGDSEAQNKIPRVGILYIVKFAEQPYAPFFFQTLRDRGWIEGRCGYPGVEFPEAQTRQTTNFPRTDSCHI